MPAVDKNKVLDDSARFQLCRLWQNHRSNKKIRLNNWFSKRFLGDVSVVNDDSTKEAWNGIQNALKNLELLPAVPGKKVPERDILVKGDEFCQ